MIDNHLLTDLSIKLSKRLLNEKAYLSTAESCTGGWLAKVITDIPGSSAYFERGFVTYSNLAKEENLHVSKDTLAKFGAVSSQTAAEMLQGLFSQTQSDYAVSITGIAGPDGGSPEKPVGLVYIGIQKRGIEPVIYEQYFEGSREDVRYLSVKFALEKLIGLEETSHD